MATCARQSTKSLGVFLPLLTQWKSDQAMCHCSSMAKILCSSMCKCVGCKNFEDSSERKTLMQLADAAEVRVQQQAAARTKMSACDLPMRPAPVSDSC
ncbi:protein lin-54 homolog isoform X3 [Amblyomma americanum]